MCPYGVKRDSFDVIIMRIVIVGAGEVGFHIADRLSREGHAVTLIEKNPQRVAEVTKRLDAMVIAGNGASSESLEAAGIGKAELFIAVAELDEVNLVACMLASEFKVPRIIARIKGLSYGKADWSRNASRLGIDRIIDPERAVADAICKAVSYSAATEVAEFADGRVVFISYRIAEDSPLAGISLKTLASIRGLYRMVITAITRGDTTIIPRGEDVIQPGDVISFVSHKKDLAGVTDLFGFQEAEARAQTAFILGGGDVGSEVARRLAASNFRVNVIDRNLQHCEALADRLKNVRALNTSGTDVETLKHEGIDKADVYIAVTQDDQANILCSLLARRHGAKRAIALVGEREYLTLALGLGVDTCVSPRLATASAILKHVRGGGILGVTVVEQSDAEVLEFLIPSDSPLLGKPLRSLPFPRGAIVGAIVRGDKAIIPGGDDSFQAQDHVIIFTLPEATARLERFFESP